MRRRVKRDLMALAGVVVVLGALVLINMNWGRGKLVARMDALRHSVEKKRESRGLPLLKWEQVRKTTGNVMTAPTYPDELKKLDGQKVDIVGFNIALNQFRNMSEFMFLPLPLECYFCQIPPMKDQLLVTMAKDKVCERLYKEPIVVSGKFRLRKNDTEKFFYFLEDAQVGPGDPDKSMKDVGVRDIKQEHMAPQHENTGNLQPGYDVSEPGSPDAKK